MSASALLAMRLCGTATADAMLLYVILAGLQRLAPLGSSLVHLDVRFCRAPTKESLSALSGLTLLNLLGCELVESGYAALETLTRLQTLAAPDHDRGGISIRL